MKAIKLHNGLEMPILGFGVYQIPDLIQCEQAVSEAIKTGYRLFDTAQIYGNEEAVGNAIKKSGVNRSEFFITTKIWISNTSYEGVKKSFENSLEKLQTDYIDLLLLHWPLGDYYGAWRAMEELYNAGKVKAIGVCNFYPDRYIDFSHFVQIKPMINQIETHIFNQQKKQREYMKKYGTQIMAWAPLAEGQNNFFNNETLKKIGNNYGKTVAQTALRFAIQENIIVIPKSVHKERIEENFNVFDFNLTDDEMNKIRNLDLCQSMFPPYTEPSMTEFLINYKLGDEINLPKE